MENKNIIPRDSAEQQVDLFLDFYDIDTDEDASDTNHRNMLKASKNKLIKHVMRGRVEISENDDGDVVVKQTLKFPVNDVDHLEYKVLGGIAKKQMKNAEDSDYSGKVYNLCGSLTGWTGNSIAKLKGVDLSVVECLGALFLVV